MTEIIAVRPIVQEALRLEIGIAEIASRIGDLRILDQLRLFVGRHDDILDQFRLTAGTNASGKFSSSRIRINQQSAILQRGYGAL